MWQGVCPAGRRLEGREQLCIGQAKPARVIIEVAGSPAVGAAAAATAAGVPFRHPARSRPAAEEGRGEEGGVAACRNTTGRREMQNRMTNQTVGC